MEILLSMVRNLVIIIMLATLLELVMPPGKLRPLVQMTVGFFVIITILNPVLTLMFHPEQLEVSAFVLPDEINRELNQALATGRVANQDLQLAMNQQLKSRLEGQMRSLALLIPGVGDVKPLVKLDQGGNIQEVNLEVETGDGKINDGDERIPAFAPRIPSAEDVALEQKLKDWISSYYEVAPERVNINWH